MTRPAHGTIFSAVVNGAAGSIAIGNVVIPDEDDDETFVVATTAERGSRRSEAVAITAFGGTGRGAIELQESGTIDASISGLAVAVTQSLVRCSATGTIERVSPGDPDTDDIIGFAELDGRVHLFFGFPIAEILALAGGGVTPTGTGFRHVTSGTEDGATKLVENADVHASAAIAVTKLATGSNNGEVLMRTAGANTFAAIANANVDAAAAIAGTKISPDFGSQAITTTGTATALSAILGSAAAAATGVVRTGYYASSTDLWRGKWGSGNEDPILNQNGATINIGAVDGWAMTWYTFSVNIWSKGAAMGFFQGSLGTEVGRYSASAASYLSAVPRLGLSAAYGSDGRATQAMADADQTLASAVYSRGIVRFTGALTGVRTATFPHPASEDGSYYKFIRNDCTGANVLLSTGTGATLSIAAGDFFISFTPSGVQS